MESTSDKTIMIQPPEYSFSEKRDKKAIFLRGYACTVTVLLLVVLAWGAVYLVKNDNKCNHAETVKLTVPSPEGGFIEVDEIQHTETFFKPGPNGSVAVMDFQQGIMGVYMEKQDICMVATGLSLSRMQEQGSESSPAHLYLRTDDGDVNQMLLPKKMKDLCDEKEIVHMMSSEQEFRKESDETPKGSARVRRACKRYCSCGIQCNPRCQYQCSCRFECRW